MAYQNPNPDALPAHAEPEEAAQILAGGYQGRPYSTASAPPGPGHRPPGGYHPGQIGHQSHPGPRMGTPGRGGPGPRPESYGPQHSMGHLGGGHGRGGGAGRGAGNGGYGHNSHPPPNPYASPPQPPPVSRPPPTPAPPQGADPTLYPLFKAVDKDGSGQLSEKELRAALVNGDWTSFDPHTVRMMIRMFDTDRSGTIGFEEFCGLWGFLAAWRTLFDRFDADRSGNISFQEFQNALAAFGYRLSPQFVQLLFRSYDRRGQDSSPQPTQQGQNAISFDLFVQSCISLKRMTEVFKKYDDDRDGYIMLSFEEFLTEILRQR